MPDWVYFTCESCACTFRRFHTPYRDVEYLPCPNCDGTMYQDDANGGGDENE